MKTEKDQPGKVSNMFAKEYGRYYRDKDGKLRIAMDLELFLTMILLIWAIPLIAIGQLIWHFLKGNVILLKKEDAYKELSEYYNKLRK